MHAYLAWLGSAFTLSCGAALYTLALTVLRAALPPIRVSGAGLRPAAWGLAGLISIPLLAQPLQNPAKGDPVLFEALKRADSQVFDEGFNHCNLALLEKVVHRDMQFLHDENGPLDREGFFKAFQESICSDPARKPIRKLVEGSVAVYPLRNNGGLYGAVQMGNHEFFIVEPGKEPRYTSSGRFVHTWLIEGGQWKLYRVVSYDHQEVVKYGPKFDEGAAFPMFDKGADIDALLKKHKVASVGIGYIKDGQVQEIRTFGERTAGQAIAQDSLYKVASLTKPVTALTVLKLGAQGKWDLDEPVAKYFVDPDIKGSPYLMKLTTRHILNHRSGFPNWRYLNKEKRLTFEFEPGTKWQYSGQGFEYLRKALEAKFKPSTLDPPATDLVFTPLHMGDTHYRWEAGVQEGRYALEHDEAGIALPIERNQTVNAAANLITTVGDYSHFLAHILEGAGLPRALYDEFVRPSSGEKPGIAWGLGMQVLPGVDGEEFVLTHTGGDPGTKAIAILLPKSSRGLLILSNSENGMVLWRKIIEEYLGRAGAEVVRRNLQ